jgi:prevent-host-death family protein
MYKVGVSTFREHLKHYLSEVKNGSIIEITSNGQTVARLVPPDYQRRTAREKLAEVAEQAELYDVLSPIDEEWEAER